MKLTNEQIKKIEALDDEILNQILGGNGSSYSKELDFKIGDIVLFSTDTIEKAKGKIFYIDPTGEWCVIIAENGWKQVADVENISKI